MIAAHSHIHIKAYKSPPASINQNQNSPVLLTTVLCVRAPFEKCAQMHLLLNNKTRAAAIELCNVLPMGVNICVYVYSLSESSNALSCNSV